MKQVFIRKGEAFVDSIPAPCVQPGMLLVRVQYSCISIGTEMSSIKNTAQPLWKRAIKNPDEVKKVIDSVKNIGLTKTQKIIKSKVSVGNPVGYSASGIVQEVGEGVKGFFPGDKVACAGTGYANHAEIIVVPQNLAVKVSKNVKLQFAATVSLGAIALQSLRRANPTLGEIFVVVGLGIIGQFVAQLLKINGCSVIGIDPDISRGKTALAIGLDYLLESHLEDPTEQVHRLTNGYGADGVIITAASPSNEIVSSAFKMCRKKGRVVLVGSVGLNLNRHDFYKKELDFFISSSYGPGRYDSNYEENGLDYPIGYVRWTEKRNMENFMQLLSTKKMKIEPLVHKIIPIEKAPMAYELLKKSDVKPLMILLEYPNHFEGKEISYAQIDRSPKKLKNKNQKYVRIAIIGAGGFVKGIHLPNINKLSDLFQLHAVVDRFGHLAHSAAIQYNAIYSGTDYQRILKDPEIDAVIITTRHNLHAKMVLEALSEGKHVFVEKPLAVTEKELKDLISFFHKRKKDTPLLQTGFNRRFSPFNTRIYSLLKNRTNPMIINYRMNAGYIPLHNWVHLEEGGGRNIGEACHIYDLFTYFTGEKITRVEAFPIIPNTKYYSSRDNFTAVINFSDGSVASLTYSALGSRNYPKEIMELYFDGNVVSMSDYKRLEIYGNKTKKLSAKGLNKGHKEELIAFAQAILHKKEWPIPLWQQIQATEIALNVEKIITGSSKTFKLENS